MEQALFVVYFFLLYVPLPQFGLFRYACLAATLGLFALNYRDTLPLLLKCWPMLPYPLFGLLSMAWSDYPSDALRMGILQLFMPILLVTVAARLRPAEFLRVMMLAGALAVLVCLPYYATFQYGGPYPQKNLLAFQMMIVTLVSLAVALNEKELTPFRVVAAGVAVVAFVIQFLAMSATSLVFSLGGWVILIGVKLFWGPVAKIAHMRSVFLLFIGAVILLITLWVMSSPTNSYINDFLGLVGKDTTLTGRTGIWDTAEEVSAEHPWFGVGLEGFWQSSNGRAASLNELVFMPPGARISFHSAFWEVRVHLGFVGLALFILTIVWAGSRTLMLWLRDGSVMNSTFLIFFFIIGTSCFTESYPSASFSTIVAMFYFGALAGFDFGARKVIGHARIVEARA